ncbi:uncharacterized protein chn [Chelonus insularis]|uniref:uncharacterized protein chn n=1 Tax=Chelonus insularis TaxID=460826 RepID=UPI00158CD5E2|nr:uncharacterized protein LOC118063725 [Chelonus insularis]XP_034933743.1 uncharacterized protein LOC118063725 [Chelonus insularis]
MESGAIGIGRLDCYEDMFKEITRKLYGDDPDHRTSSVQNEFEASVSYKNDEDNTTDDDANWTCEDEPLKGTDGSRIAAYNAAKTTWRCYECGDCMSGSPRDVAEHFIELHSSRIIVEDSRTRDHSSRKDYLSDPKLEDILVYLERVREKAERIAPPSRRTQETQTIPAALLPATTPFLLQELPSTPPQHLHSSPTMMASSATTLTSSKRYTCPYCPYGTDRRDLYTRHENIHREEKPFHCYVCFKPFNRADHVKKHFLRMHREHTYELSRIRRTPGSNNDIKPLIPETNNTSVNGNTQINGNYTTNFNNNKSYQLQTSQTSANSTPSLYQTTSMTVGNIQDANCGNRRLQTTGCNSKSHLKAGSKGALERRYTCCYCSWSGVDNWCLKRHLNTHLKPFACALCEYKAARAERLATHVLKVHNKRQCSRCSFLGEDTAQLQLHQLHVHRINTGNTNTSVPTTSTTQVSLQSSATPTNTTNSTATCNRDQPLHLGGVGRPPPGPPVFPTTAPTIAPPPTTILGQISTNGRSRSRKQSEPRKIIKQYESEEEENMNEELNKKFQENKKDEKITIKNSNNNSVILNNNNDKKKINKRLFRCYLCPKHADARAFFREPYHSRASLLLHILWHHRRTKINHQNIQHHHRKQPETKKKKITK